MSPKRELRPCGTHRRVFGQFRADDGRGPRGPSLADASGYDVAPLKREFVVRSIPEDIARRVRQLFPGDVRRAAAAEVVADLFGAGKPVNVGSSQFSRAVLTLAGNNLAELRRLATKPEDPRDTIVRASRSIDRPGYDFSRPFGEAVTDAGGRDRAVDA